jgi:uncharacterized protein (UPF0335 family)
MERVYRMMKERIDIKMDRSEVMNELKSKHNLQEYKIES